MATIVSSLDNSAYHDLVKLRGYAMKVNVFQAVTVSDAARVLAIANPAWTKSDHIELSNRHLEEARRLKRQWSLLVDEACMETFGRKFEFTDYKITAIAREEFSEEIKEKLRFAAYAEANHSCLGLAHKAASRLRRR